MNLFTKKIADDFIYSQSNGLLDIFAREYEQYMTWSGRSVAHVLARISLALPRILFVLCNSLVFVWLIIMIVFHADPSEKHVPFLLAVSAALVFLYIPMFGETVLWQTGSFNYLWMTTLIMTFLIPYRQNGQYSILFSVLYFFCGILAGWTNENTAGAMILFMLGMILKNLVLDHRKPGIHMLTGLAGALIGILMMVKAPGNAVRMLSFPARNGLSSLLIAAYEASIVISGAGDTGMRTLWLLFAAVITIAGIATADKKKLYVPLLFAFCSFAAVYAMILSPVYINFSRSMFGATVFLIAGIISSVVLIMDTGRFDIPCKTGLAVVTALSAMNYMTAMIDLVNTRYQFRNYDRYISSQKAAGNLNPVVPALARELMTRYDPIYDLEGIQGDDTHWINQNFSIMNGLESISSTKSDLWNQIYRDGEPALMNITDYDIYLNAVRDNEDYIVLVTSTDLTDESYTDMYWVLQEFLETNHARTGYIAAAVSTADSQVIARETEIYEGLTVEGHYFYLSSMEDPENSDIVISTDNLSNKNPGITVSVYSKTKGHLVDEITWRPETRTHGIRSCSEQYNKRDNAKD
ncbi:MAG: hypothetical protein IJI75_03835 [Solobacterium sp.]|nr:hypothetical protein [Solobacterium sp.]